MEARCKIYEQESNGCERDNLETDSDSIFGPFIPELVHPSINKHTHSSFAFMLVSPSSWSFREFLNSNFFPQKFALKASFSTSFSKPRHQRRTETKGRTESLPFFPQTARNSSYTLQRSSSYTYSRYFNNNRRYCCPASASYYLDSTSPEVYRRIFRVPSQARFTTPTYKISFSFRISNTLRS